MFLPENLSKILRLDWETDRIVKFNIHHLDICDLNEFDKKILTTFPDYKKHLESLDDVADNAEEVVIENDEETVDLSE